jgi:hypothetical protein
MLAVSMVSVPPPGGRHQDLHRLAGQFGRGVPEHPLGLGVDHEDRPVLGHGEGGVRRGVEQRAEPLLGLPGGAERVHQAGPHLLRGPAQVSQLSRADLGHRGAVVPGRDRVGGVPDGQERP